MGILVVLWKSRVMARSPFTLFINARHWSSCHFLSAIAWHWSVSSVGECCAPTCELQVSPLPRARVKSSASTSDWKKNICFVWTWNHEGGEGMSLETVQKSVPEDGCLSHGCLEVKTKKALTFWTRIRYVVFIYFRFDRMGQRDFSQTAAFPIQ